MDFHEVNLFLAIRLVRKIDFAAKNYKSVPSFVTKFPVVQE